MLEAISQSPPPAQRGDRHRLPTAILVSTVFGHEEVGRQIGAEAYSYRFAFHAFLPLLREVGEVIEVRSSQSRLDFAVREARARGFEPIHLSFRPLQDTYLSSLVPNLAFPFWEFPDVPDEDFDDNPRNNWLRIAGRLSGVLCASEFTRDAFLRAGVRTPVSTVPVPIRAEYFDLAAWHADSAGNLPRAAAWVTCHRSEDTSMNPWAPPPCPPTFRSRARLLHEERLRPSLPVWANRRLDRAIRTGKQWLGIAEEEVEGDNVSHSRLSLRGVVYTSIFNPFDPRKNWQDLLSAFLIALSDRGDAMLVLKLVVPPELSAGAVGDVREYCQRLGLRHQCKLALVTEYLSDQEILELTRLSTYYVTATRAEGACLPAQDFLAAGRPLIAPCHSSLADYVTSDVAFPVASHPEPASWPHDRSRQIRTTWHRIVWQSLHDQIRASYAFARDAESYQQMSRRCREHMRGFAAQDRVRPRLQRALEPFVDARAAVR